MLLAGCERSTEKPFFPNLDSDPIWKLIPEVIVENSPFAILQSRYTSGILEYIDIQISTNGENYPCVWFGGGMLAILNKVEDNEMLVYDTSEYSDEMFCRQLPSKQQLKHLELQTAIPITPATYLYSKFSDIEITADKRLWGLEAGSNLMDMFEMRIEQPRIDYQTFEISPKSLSATAQNEGLFEAVTSEQLKGSLLPKNYFFKPKVAHEERYDQVTFCVTIESEVEDTTITRTQTFVVNFEK